MNIKITNTGEAKSDALVVLNSADSFESLVSTMETLKISIENSWSDCTAKTSAINNLISSIDYYKNKIIRALNKLGTSVDAYALATEQLAAASVNGGGNNAGLSQLSQSETSYATPSEYSDSQSANNAVGTVSATGERTVELPSGYVTSTTTYMNWNQNWNEGSNQRAFFEQTRTDNSVTCDQDGFYYVNDGSDDRYVVATTLKYGNVGDCLDVYQQDGSVLKCIIGDVKSYNDANSGEYGHMYSGTINVLEYMTNWNGGHSNPGMVRSSLNQNVLKVVNTGQKYDY